MRDSLNVSRDYDLKNVLEALNKETSEFTIFGGEPLLTSIDDLEVLFKLGYERFKKNGIQSNGILITPRHIELFKLYNVHVGLSIDGPDELNGARCNEKLTQKVQENIKLLSESKVKWSVIITLSRQNGAIAKREKFKTWISSLINQGCSSIRLHLLEDDGDINHLKLSNNELIELLSDIESLGISKIDLFQEIRDRVRGNSKAGSCVFQGCDPYTTPAVQSIGGDGIKYNCGRVNKEGVDFIKGDTHRYDRSLVLYNTPIEHGGCAGCRFFNVCNGYCPGTAIDKDWRNRTEFCSVLLHFYNKYERELLLEGGNVVKAKSPTINYTNQSHGDAHGDKLHGDSSKTILTVPVIGRGGENNMGLQESERILETNPR